MNGMAFKAAMGNPDWAEEEKFATFENRKANEAELNEKIEAWTASQYSDDLMKLLMANGVKAGMVNDARAAIEDKHLAKA